MQKTVFGDVPELTAGDVEPEGTNSTIADTIRTTIELNSAIDAWTVEFGGSGNPLALLFFKEQNGADGTQDR